MTFSKIWLREGNKSLKTNILFAVYFSPLYQNLTSRWLISGSTNENVSIVLDVKLTLTVCIVYIFPVRTIFNLTQTFPHYHWSTAGIHGSSSTVQLRSCPACAYPHTDQCITHPKLTRAQNPNPETHGSVLCCCWTLWQVYLGQIVSEKLPLELSWTKLAVG